MTDASNVELKPRGAGRLHLARVPSSKNFKTRLQISYELLRSQCDCSCLVVWGLGGKVQKYQQPFLIIYREREEVRLTVDKERRKHTG